jgi:hypothetical protein
MVTDYNSLVENLTTAEVRFLISDVPAFGDWFLDTKLWG